MITQTSSQHHGQEVLWTDRDGIVSALFCGFHILIERVIPTPEALTEDRKVVAISRRRFRLLVDGVPTDPDREFFDTAEEAKAFAADTLCGAVKTIADARLAWMDGSSAAPVPCEEWL